MTTARRSIVCGRAARSHSYRQLWTRGPQTVRSAFSETILRVAYKAY